MSSNSSSGGFVNVTHRNPCPICGKPDWCSVSEDGNVVLCRRAGNPAETRYDKNGGSYWIHRLSDSCKSTLSNPIHSRSVAHPAISLEPSVLDEMYRFLLHSLCLHQEHVERLQSKYGISGREIQQRGYRSWPLRGRADIVNKCLETFGFEKTTQVPGVIFKTERDGVALEAPYWTLAGAPGIAIPVRNMQGQIIAVKIRSDRAASEGNKYTYLSSKKYGGNGPGAQVHIPLYQGTNHEVVRITEGELKADSATIHSGIRTVSIPGVGAWNLVAPVLKELKPQKVFIALDADLFTNRNVAGPFISLVNALQKDWEIVIETWDDRGGAAKGIDDLLLAGGRPSLTTGPEQISALIQGLAETFKDAALFNGPAAAPQKTEAEMKSPSITKRLIEGVEPDYACHFLPLAQAQKKMEWTIRNYFHSEDAHPLLINATVGLGKTEIVLRILREEINQRRLRKAWYLCSTIELAGEINRRFGEDGATIRGRTQSSPDGRRLCQRWKIITQIQKSVLSVTKSMCRQGERVCPHYQDCLYLKQFEDAKTKSVLFMAHEYACIELGQDKPLPKPEIVILDENAMRIFLGDPYPFKKSQFLEDAQSYKDAAEMIDEEISEGRLPFERLEEAGCDAGKLKSIQGELDKESRPPILPGMSDDEIRKLVQQYKRNAAALVFGRLGQEWPAAVARNEIYSVKVIEDEIKILFRKAHKLPKESKILLLDATADKRLLEPSFPRIECVDIHAEQNLNVVQVHGFRGSKAAYDVQKKDGEWNEDVVFDKANMKISDSGRNHIQILNDFIDRILKQNPADKIAVITHADMEEKIMKSDRLTTGHFGNIRGLDGFKDCDAVIIAGRPQPSIRDIENQAKAIFFDKNVKIEPLDDILYLPETERGYLLKSGRRLGARIPYHPDPICNAMLEQVREAEIIQAIGRLRAVWSPRPKKVYLLTEIPIPGLIIDELIPYNGYVKLNRLSQAMNDLNGVLPLRADWLAAKFPHYWSTEKAAKRDLQRSQENSDTYYGELKGPIFYNIYYRKAGLLTHRQMLYEYRLSHQRRGSKCISIYDWQTTLNKLTEYVGEVVDLKLMASENGSDHEGSNGLSTYTQSSFSDAMDGSPVDSCRLDRPPEFDIHYPDCLEDLYSHLKGQIITRYGSGILEQALSEDCIRVKLPDEKEMRTLTIFEVQMPRLPA